MFREDFIWGAATASYQIEGAAFEDGKGLSIWDTHCMEPGNVLHGDTGNIACDHYHKYKEDVALMKEMGLKAYRFSISWARILPEGIGKVNQKGIEFYNNLINELIAANITPYITLFHWDYPQALQNKGAWMNSESSEWFKEYARVVAENFGDRVKHYITFNEPQVFFSGYNGSHPPKHQNPPQNMVPMAHNILLAHGKAVLEIRKIVKDAKVGFAPCGNFFYPLDESSKTDIAAARELMFKIEEMDNNFCGSITWWSDPVCLGRYPEKYSAFHKQFLPKNYEEDLKIIHQPLDFYCQNIYGGMPATTNEKGEPIVAELPPGFSRMANTWGTVTPKSIKWATYFLYERYGLPIIISENGMCNNDTVSLDGKVHDPQRIDYLHRYLSALNESIEMGTDVRGYFQWSLLDNFEWLEGYRDRFGLIYVDYKTLKRTPKDSAYWYKQVIAQNGKNL